MSGHESLVRVKEKLARQPWNTVQIPFPETWMGDDKNKSTSLQWLKASVWIWVSVHVETVFLFFLLVTLGSKDGSGSTHLQFSMPMRQSRFRASPTMARVSGALKNPAFVPTAQTKSLLMISISLPRWECFINSVCLVTVFLPLTPLLSGQKRPR